jgi:hypothetical protein
MSDIVQEAIRFYYATRDDKRFDLSSPLVWDYTLGPVRPDQVEAAVRLLEEQGFASVEAVPDQESRQELEIRLSELEAHTLDSYADRIRGLADFAAEHGVALRGWSVDDGKPGPEGGDAAAAPGAIEPAGYLTRQEIAAFAC